MNRAIWRGYSEIQEAAGWVALVFSGMGLYRFCKYRESSIKQDIGVLRGFRSRFELAADTIHPNWRTILCIVGESAEPRFRGHPHDWVVSKDHDPMPLATTYIQWYPDFHFKHIDQSSIDESTWEYDPREVMATTEAVHTCPRCGKTQSDAVGRNTCECYPDLFGINRRPYCPVQIYRTDNGRNNGLLACCVSRKFCIRHHLLASFLTISQPFERGVAIGEFVGTITRGKNNVDVMEESTQRGDYQIFQGHEGNFTRFINHSCRPNAQFEKFVWLGVQRIVLVSKGINMGSEVTVDYSENYWGHLDKKCLCGAAGCRYADTAKGQ